jgi:hypothetical protein
MLHILFYKHLLCCHRAFCAFTEQWREWESGESETRMYCRTHTERAQYPVSTHIECTVHTEHTHGTRNPEHAERAERTEWNKGMDRGPGRFQVRVLSHTYGTSG